MAYWTWFQSVWVLIAIVPVIKSECDVQLSCEFEQGMCSWTQAESNNVDWKRKKGTTIPCAGPNQDHTTNNESGFYVYIEPLNIQNQISRIVSPVDKGRKLVHLWYNMQYVIDAFISVKILVNSVGKSPLFYEYGNQGDQWKHSTVVIEEDGEYKIEIFSSTGTSSCGVVAIDDVTVKNYIECDVQLSCDFEQGMCSWNQAESNNVDWKRKKGTTIPCAGPNQDHTTKNESGFYMYIEPLNIQNQISRVVSPVVKGRKLVRLWYHMQYVIDAFISVKILINEVGKSPLFYDYGNQGDQWKHSTVVIEEDGEYKIEIFGSTGTSSCGVVAIDDVTVEDYIVTKHYSELFRNTKPVREPFRTFSGHHGIRCATRCTEFHQCTYFTTHVTGHCSLYHGEDVTNVLPGDGTTIWRRDIVC